MSTPAAAVESAAPAPVDPSGDAGDATAAAESPFGSIADVREALGLGDDDGAEAEATDAGADKPKAPKAEAKKPEAAADEDPDAAAILAINKRSAAHRKARIEKARAAQAPVAAAKPPEAPAKPAEAAKVEAKPDAKPELTEAARAAQEVLGLIAKLAGDDKEAAKADEDPTAKQAAERQELVASIKAQLDSIGASTKEAAKEEAKALKDEVESLKAQLGGIEGARRIREHIEAQVEPIIAELPTLMGKRNAIAILHEGAGKFFDTYKKFPDVAELARRIEAKLAADPNEKTEKPNEKRPQTRKTVSNQLGSPPAARSGPDTRSAEQAEADFYSRFGIDH